MEKVRPSPLRKFLLKPVLPVMAAGLLFVPANAALAQQPQVHLHLDPAATEVHFTLKDTLHTVHGSFRLSSGEIDFNPQSGEAHGLFSVDTSSGASGNDGRDGRMKREFLEVVKFPVATFEPQKVTGYIPAADSQQISVAGVMTVHGAGHPLVLAFSVSKAGDAATATTHFTIPYVQWGIKDPSIAFVKVEKEVSMDIVAKGMLTTAK